MDFMPLINFIANNKLFDNMVNVKSGVRDGLNSSDYRKIKNYKAIGTNSIKYKSKQSIAQYPVLMSSNVSSQLAPVIAHALENQYAGMVALTLQNTADFAGHNAADVVGTFHSNIDKFKTFRNEGFLPGVETTSYMEEANKELLMSIIDKVNTNCLNESSYTRDMIKFLEANGSLDNNNPDDRFKMEMDYKKKRDKIKDKQAGMDRAYRIRSDRERRKREDEERAYRRERDKKMDEDRAKQSERDRREKLANARYKGINLTNSDVLKNNDMMPTILNMEINFKDPNSDVVINKQISIGVKCVLHLLDSDDIEYHLARAAYKDTNLMRLIKWTTGEISFFKGFLFAVQDAKRTALKSRNHHSDWFYTLEKIASMKKLNTISDTPDNAFPISTLVITKDDVENIKYKNGLDLMKKPQLIDKIMKRFYLMNFMIVDEGLDIIYMYDETNRNLDRYPISSFEKVSKSRSIDASDIKKLLK